MRMSAIIDVFVVEMRADGRFNSPATEQTYRATLLKHAEDVDNRDPRTTNRDDVTKTLRRWSHPNTRALSRAHLVSFYDWCVETGVRKDNPARQTRRPRTRKPTVYRLTREEVRSFRAAAFGPRERAMVDFGLLAGLRAKELLGLQGRHLRRTGWVWVSEDIAKGGRERWVPVLPELQQTFDVSAEHTGDSEFVIANRKQGMNFLERRDVFDQATPASYQSLYQTIRKIGRRAGIAAPVTPHMMRHAFGDHVARFAGTEVAQFVLGHQSIATTQGYTGAPTLDEVASALAEFGYGAGQLPAEDRPVRRLAASGGSFHLEPTGSGPERDLGRILVWLRANPRFQDAAEAMAVHA